MSVSGVGVYGALLRLPGTRTSTAAALVGRMPISMLGIGAVLLLVDRRDSYGLAGAVSAGFAAGQAVLGPFVSRLVDRRGERAVLPAALATHTTAVVALVLLAGTAAPAAVLLATAALAGASLPPLGAAQRTRWAQLLGAHGRRDRLPTAFALESVLDEVVFVVGPLLVVACATLLGPAAGLVLALLLGAAGTLAFVARRPPGVPDHVPGGPRTPTALRSGGLRVLVASSVAVGSVFGALEVVMVAFADERGPRAKSGPLLALVAVGSAGAGLVYGSRAWTSTLDRRYLQALAGLALGVVPLLLAPSVLLMVPAALLAGVAVSPTLIAASGLVEALVPAGARTEGFTLQNAGLGLGVAAGSAAAGALADAAGSRAGFAVCLAGGLLALAVAAAGRRALAPDLLAARPARP